MAAGAAVAGLGLQLYGQHKQSQQQAEAAEDQAAAKREQGIEILGRSEENIKRFRREGEKFKAQQVASFAASGVDVGSGVTLQQLEETNFLLAQNVADQRREAAFKAEQLFKGADINQDLAGDIRSAGGISLLGTGLSGAAGIASLRNRKVT